MHHNCKFATLTAIHPSCRPWKHNHSERADSSGGGVLEPSYPLIQGKWLNIQTRDSTHIYHKQLHGIRTSFSSSLLAQSQVAGEGGSHSAERFISKLYSQLDSVGGGVSGRKVVGRSFATTEATTVPHQNATTNQEGHTHSVGERDNPIRINMIIVIDLPLQSHHCMSTVDTPTELRKRTEGEHRTESDGRLWDLIWHTS